MDGRASDRRCARLPRMPRGCPEFRREGPHLEEDDEEDHVRPRKLPKLVDVRLAERGYKHDEADVVQDVRYEHVLADAPTWREDGQTRVVAVTSAPGERESVGRRARLARAGGARRQRCDGNTGAPTMPGIQLFSGEFTSSSRLCFRREKYPKNAATKKKYLLGANRGRLGGSGEAGGARRRSAAAVGRRRGGGAEKGRDQRGPGGRWQRGAPLLHAEARELLLGVLMSGEGEQLVHHDALADRRPQRTTVSGALNFPGTLDRRVHHERACNAPETCFSRLNGKNQCAGDDVPEVENKNETSHHEERARRPDLERPHLR